MRDTTKTHAASLSPLGRPAARRFECSRRVLTSGAAALALLGCTTRDAPPPAGRGDTAATAAGPAPAPGTSSRVTPVRGRLASLSDTALTVTSATGDVVRVALVAPVAKYTRVPADLSQVTEHSFVGVTSVAQPDGSQRATEIHVFPEQLRGTGEGSYLMAQQQGARGGGSSDARSTMTNGTVAGSRGSSAGPGGGAAPRMTNGTVGGSGSAGQAGRRTLTVQYGGGSQTIIVPPDVPVTAITVTQTPLRVGANVVVLAAKQPDGALRSSAVMLLGESGSKK